jgi:hypothetical protein
MRLIGAGREKGHAKVSGNGTSSDLDYGMV